jgi:LemA protein
MLNLLAFILVVLSIVILGAVVVGLYNNLVKLRNGVENAWSDINMELERRISLTDNLVETVKRYATHEKSTMEEVTQASYNLQDAWAVHENAEADIQLTHALNNLFVMAENYPNLKVDKSFKTLTEQLTEIEDMIFHYRQFYNDKVYVYNNKCHMFPNNIVANYFGFQYIEYFQPGEEFDGNPDLDLDPENNQDELTTNSSASESPSKK